MSTAVLALFGFIVLSWVALGELRRTMVEDRLSKVEALTQVAVATAKAFDDRARAGEFDQATARAQAIETLRHVRYQGQEYFFIYTDDGTTVMLPPKPEREGKNFMDTKDADGVPFIRQLVEGAKAGGGKVFYKFPRANSDQPVAKVSYAGPYQPWGWVIGTGIYLDDVDAEFRSAAWRFALIALAVTLVSLVLAGLLARGIARPILRLSHAAERLAQRDFSIEIDRTERHDEIGALTRAIAVLRDEAAQVEATRAEQQEGYRLASIQRREARLKLADDVEATIKRVSDVLVDAVADMEGAARTVSGAVQSAGNQAAGVVATAEQASANVATVAAAAEQLSASIHEIASQVHRSSDMSRQAVGEAERTNALVLSLAEAAGRIGEVVTLINDIAAQTNLLALNATIEAARAGDAGKGFAVVAGEVKTLANQTARATEEISNQIGAVQSRTREAVAAIRGIGDTIGILNDIAGAIAAAVEQQGAATQEIARNVQEAASGTQEVAGVLGHLSAATAEAGGSAESVLYIAGRLTSEAGSLETEIHNFMDTVRSDKGAQG
ncbi:methyl-accepting chemotaxis protein [Magnetospirillum sp. SS-4]|uniref:methyl-accepting chemotaxis protein n=1 Tax=Magnetospirillum sp. SS-4 TaxID=2681465 RepID=UPI0020C4DF85|nr:methyl-accepting chemotaxis protein [Magnetospirillum sp. SS-4]